MTEDHRSKLQRLDRGVYHCRACPLWKNRTHAVPGEGALRPTVMLIGEAPGREEDLQGRPFCGRSGHTLDNLLQRVGLDRRQVYITSSVKCHPPHNRDPHADELKTCRHRWLEDQIALLEPSVILLLGRTPARQLLDEKHPLSSIHGRLRHWNGLPLMITYHPASAMRFPRARRAAQQDFDCLRRILDRMDR